VFDHVGIAVSDFAASERFYRTVLSVLGAEPSHADAELVEWDDWDIGPTDREHPVTRGLHVGFRARDRAQADAFWRAGVDAGYRDDGAPGPRTQYGPTYYGGFLFDPDGNSVEAVHGEREDAVPDGRVAVCVNRANATCCNRCRNDSTSVRDIASEGITPHPHLAALRRVGGSARVTARGRGANTERWISTGGAWRRPVRRRGLPNRRVAMMDRAR
jgi:catechol 2,3-dioxygenase-like lactoylglutathione lyase family enzyme